MTTFGARLKAARLAKGYTQDDLSDLLGVTKSAVSAWENDRETPAFDKLVSIRKSVGASLDDLVFGEQSSQYRIAESAPMQYPVPPPRDQVRTPEERSIVKLFRAMNDRQRRGLLAAFGTPLQLDAEGAAVASQDLSPADLSMAIQLANEKIAAAGLAPTPEQYGQLVLSLHDVLVGGLPHADVHDLRTGQLRNSSSGDHNAPATHRTAGQGQQPAQPVVEHLGKAARKSRK